VEVFFERLDRARRVVFTWDVQNFWQMGTFPSLDVYRRLKEKIGYYHVKGGRAEPGRRSLVWRSTLQDASWPVLEITRAVCDDGVSPVICLNPSHGKPNEQFPMEKATEIDLAFLRRHFLERQ
jgi:sugar phosphate isomerase/epimerase